MVNIVSGNYNSKVDGQAYATNPLVSENDYAGDMFSNVIDIGDVSEFEHVEKNANEVTGQGLFGTIKSFVGSFFGDKE